MIGTKYESLSVNFIPLSYFDKELYSSFSLNTFFSFNIFWKGNIFPMYLLYTFFIYAKDILFLYILLSTNALKLEFFLINKLPNTNMIITAKTMGTCFGD